MARTHRCRPVPTILQLEALECGAAALGMVLAHYGRWVPLVELRRLCGVSRDGSRASNMVKAARELGLEAEGYRLPAEELRTVRKPAIVFVNANHYVVLEAFGRLVRVSDPAGGRITYTRREFEEIYSGIALTFRPTPGFARAGRAPRTLRPLLGRLKGVRAIYLLLVAAGLSLTIPTIVVPAFTRTFIDQYVVDKQADFVPWIIAAMAVVVLFQACLTRIQHWGQLTLRNAIAIGIATDFMWRALRMPVGFFAQRSPATIGARADLAERTAEQASGPLAGLAVAALSALVFLGLMTLYNPLLALLVAGIALVSAALSVVSRRKVEEVERKIALDALKLGSTTMQGLSLLETIKAGGSEERFLETWTGQQALMVNGQQRLGRLMGLSAALTESIGGLGSAAVLAVGGYLVMGGQLTLGLLMAFLILQAAFFAPVRQILGSTVALGRGRAMLDQLEDIEAPALAPEFSPAAETPEQRAGALGRVRKLRGAIALRDVTFGYARLSRPLIEGLSLSIAPGSAVAVVGASGSGKSTLGRLISGLHEPWSGAVALDGQPIPALPRPLVRNSMAVIDQDIALFKGTIRDNIALWDASVPEERLVRAAKDAAIHDEILKRPAGYDDPVEEDGRNFSGGQRQRLEIARALVTDPSILVLDEATSALDPVTEKIISDNIRRRGCTILVIAHRLSTVRDCDEILVMDKGAIVQRGTHESLMAIDGPYRDLVRTSEDARAP
ncbi:NHLP family bacteriocin export ABC transporter peptidase/permease/ATPase subunit [Methylobacterium aquaticum]|uniref:NHLP family bacteriocin export ABC transporter peptidase/permease/ATPase subunit n=1 Tax=Methylobacterium aquaticum TaxID=270351 RepID=UPI003D17BB3B